jgi:hypothetical protein
MITILIVPVLTRNGGRALNRHLEQIYEVLHAPTAHDPNTPKIGTRGAWREFKQTYSNFRPDRDDVLIIESEQLYTDYTTGNICRR